MYFSCVRDSEGCGWIQPTSDYEGGSTVQKSVSQAAFSVSSFADDQYLETKELGAVT